MERNAAIQTMPGASRDSGDAVGADGKRHDDADHDEEQHQRQRIAPTAGGEPQVAADEGEERGQPPPAAAQA